MGLLLTLALVAVVFLLGLHLGERAGVKETERRWAESAKRFEAFMAERLMDAHSRAQKAEAALKAKL
jgi:hypothetical protein